MISFTDLYTRTRGLRDRTGARAIPKSDFFQLVQDLIAKVQELFDRQASDFIGSIDLSGTPAVYPAAERGWWKIVSDVASVDGGDLDGIAVKAGGQLVCDGVAFTYVENTELTALYNDVINNMSIVEVIKESVGNITKSVTEDYTEISGIAEAEAGYYAKSTGGFVANSSYRSKKFPIDPTLENFVTAVVSGGAVALAIYYDSEGSFLSYQNVGSDGVYDYYRRKRLAVPKTAAFVGLTNRNSDYYTILETGGTSVQIVPKLNKLNESTKGVFEISGIAETEAGYYAKSTGAFVSNSAWLSKKYPIEEGKEYLATTVVSGSSLALAFYFDFFGKYIGFENAGEDGVLSSYHRRTLDIPDGTFYIGLTNHSATIYPILEVNDFDIPEVALDYIVEKAFPEDVNGYYSSAGTLVEAANWISATFRLLGNKDYYLTSEVSGSATAMAVFFDKNMVFISRQNVGTDGVTDSYVREKLTVPENAVYAGLTNYSETNYAVLESIGFAPVTSSYVETLVDKKLIAKSLVNYWNNKNIVWFGTSIPAGGYPELVGAKLEATVHNEAVGSSMARAFMYTGSMVGLNYINCLKALSQTIAEKQHLMDNWATNLDSNGLTAGEGGVAPFTYGWRDLLTGTPPEDYTTFASTEEILGWSYENKLTAKYLDSTDSGFVVAPDLFVFDHGHNDLNSLLKDDTCENAIAVPAIRNDRGRFIGAINYLIDEIFKYNPRARIVFIGHYENARKTMIYRAQENLAEYWDFPLMKLWQKLGWSQQTVETTGYWVDVNTWVPSGGEPQTLTMTQIWMYDNLHPYSDDSKALIAKSLSEFLKTVV